MLTRRTLIRRLAVLPSATVAGALAATTAHAFNLEQPGRDVEALYGAARSCGGDGSRYHARLLADVNALLDGRDLPAVEREDAVAAVRCPLCGCPVTDA